MLPMAVRLVQNTGIAMCGVQRRVMGPGYLSLVHLTTTRLSVNASPDMSQATWTQPPYHGSTMRRQGIAVMRGTISITFTAALSRYSKY